MTVGFTFLGSGSSGNCAYLEAADVRILVGAGFSPRQIRQRFAGIGRARENLSAILITHEHADHIADKFQIPVYYKRDTQEATAWALKEK